VQRGKNGGVDNFDINDWWSNFNILNIYVSYGSAARFSKSGKKYYIRFVDISFLFPAVKEFSKSVNS